MALGLQVEQKMATNKQPQSNFKMMTTNKQPLREVYLKREWQT